jgi:hypothetical protein
LLLDFAKQNLKANLVQINAVVMPKAIFLRLAPQKNILKGLSRKSFGGECGKMLFGQPHDL